MATTIKLERLLLDHYKKFQSLEVNFYDVTKISGRNQSGKTTIMDSYLEIMTGKGADGRLPDSVITNDINGNQIPKQDSVREIDIRIDNTPVKIKKRTYQKWRKPRGAVEETFDGLALAYEVDGFPYKPEAFKDWIGKIVEPDVLLMCSSAMPFLSALNKSTADARKILEKLSGFNVDEFITQKPEFSEIASVTKGHAVEDVIKKLRKQLTDEKKRIDEKNTEIRYETTRESVNNDISALRQQLSHLEQQRKAIEENEAFLDNAVNELDSLQRKIWKLKESAQGYVNSARSKYAEKSQSLKNSLYDIQTKAMDAAGAKENIMRKQSALILENNNLDLLIKKMKEEYRILSMQEFDDTELQRVQAETLSDDALICPTCGQEFPPDRREQILKEFDGRKAARIQREIDKREAFLKNTEAHLVALEKQVKEELQRRNDNNETIAAYDDDIKRLNNDIIAYGEQEQEIKEKINAIPEFNGEIKDPQYLNALKGIEELEGQLAQYDDISSKRADIRMEMQRVDSETMAIKARINASAQEEQDKKRRLEAMNVELRELSQNAADIERQIDMVREFSKQKNDAIASVINPVMNGFQFRFLAYTNEGNPYETCEIWKDGVDYKNLNHSDKLIVQANLVRGLQKLNGINLPIWIDDAESINGERIPKLDTQTIVLSVSENPLTVQNAGKA